MKNSVRIVMFLLLAMDASRAADSTGAQWIWQSADGQPKAWMTFRKTVNVPSVTQKVLANIAVDNHAWITSNQQLLTRS